MNAFVDEHRARLGVEPICSALQVAPSAYRRHAARRRNPALLPARARRDAQLMPLVQGVYDQNLQVYGADKVWRQLLREGTAVAPLHRRAADATARAAWCAPRQVGAHYHVGCQGGVSRWIG